MVDLTGKPFHLTQQQIDWVINTRDQMNDDEKAEQLFCPLIYSTDLKEAQKVGKNHTYGGIMFRSGDSKEICNAINTIQKNSKIPLLISANLEDGGIGIATDGTYMGRQMLIAATGDKEKAYQLGKICGKEGAVVGVNWGFAPVVDVDQNFHNPITNVRTYGDDPENVISFAREYIRGCMEEGVVPTIKHFPGDGQDERDQHLLTSVNPLSIDKWEACYGKIYRTLINEGIMAVMVGHIAMPAMEEYFDKEPVKKVIPASCSKNIMTNYLRGELGFNGLISTDASPMVGFTSNTKRREAVPRAIEAGADIFLFSKDLEEDITYMKEGIKNGLLSRKRLDDAVTRILAMKASLKLPQKLENGTILKSEEELKVLGCEEHKKWAKECAEQGITLVKDEQKIFPLSPKKTKRVLLEILGDFPSNERVNTKFQNLLIKEGFEVENYVPETLETIFLNGQVEQFKERYDLVIYVGNIENASNKTVARIHWHTLFGAGNNLPWFVQEVPTIFISVGNPYHLFDVPMVKTYINAYCNSDDVIDAIVEKLMGRSEFKGISPIDPFCGCWDTRL